MLLSTQGLQLYVEPHLDGFVNTQAVGLLPDHSVNARHLTTGSNEPVYYTNMINGRGGVYWNGSAHNPLVNSSVIQMQCGFMVLQYNEALFSNSAGILTDIDTIGILHGNSGTANFYNANFNAGANPKLYEFRSNDRIYPETAQPAPMSVFRIVFFRFWKPVTMSGIVLGRGGTNNAQRAKMNVALLALYNAENPYTCESTLRAAFETLAAAYNLTLQSNVYPYQADDDGSSESPAQSANIYDPPEGSRIAEVLGGAKRMLDLKFSFRRPDEVRRMKTFHKNYYPEVPAVYRDYKILPPEDIEGYIDSPYELGGEGNNLNYGFRFKEK